MDEHLDELVELYALGALGETETLRVHEHSARCGHCERLLGEAERMIAFLDAAMVPQVMPPRSLGKRFALRGQKVCAQSSRPNAMRFAALAASLLLAAAGALGAREVLHVRAIVAQDDAALGAIANSHFSHLPFTKVQPDAPTAKVLWRPSQWIYVIVDSPACRCRVVADTVAGERDLGTPLPRGKTAALFARNDARMLRLQLRDGTRILATAQLMRP